MHDERRAGVIKRKNPFRKETSSAITWNVPFVQLNILRKHVGFPSNLKRRRNYPRFVTVANCPSLMRCDLSSPTLGSSIWFRFSRRVSANWARSNRGWPSDGGVSLTNVFRRNSNGKICLHRDWEWLQGKVMRKLIWIALRKLWKKGCFAF